MKRKTDDYDAELTRRGNQIEANAEQIKANLATIEDNRRTIAELLRDR